VQHEAKASHYILNFGLPFLHFDFCVLLFPGLLLTYEFLYYVLQFWMKVDNLV